MPQFSRRQLFTGLAVTAGVAARHLRPGGGGRSPVAPEGRSAILARVKRRAVDAPAVSPMRSFDPRMVGALECRTWVTYYRHEWGAFLVAAVRVVRHAFGFSWPRTLVAAWWVLRANQVWAPYPNNRPDLARDLMRRFYSLLARTSHEDVEPEEAARLEVEWWRVHRELQHRDDPAEGDDEPLVAALQALYAFTYSVPAEAVRLAAEERAAAMRISDQWVRDGADPGSRRVPEERAALVRSYAALLAAVHRAPARAGRAEGVVREPCGPPSRPYDHPGVGRIVGRR
jgi:hypothetical protein